MTGAIASTGTWWPKAANRADEVRSPALSTGRSVSVMGSAFSFFRKAWAPPTGFRHQRVNFVPRLARWLEAVCLARRGMVPGRGMETGAAWRVEAPLLRCR